MKNPPKATARVRQSRAAGRFTVVIELRSPAESWAQATKDAALFREMLVRSNLYRVSEIRIEEQNPKAKRYKRPL